LARIKVGLSDCIYLGNVDAKRDWGHAKDFVEAQWLILQQQEAEDYVIATGQQHSVRDFAQIAAKKLGMQLEWRGKGVDEEAWDTNTGKQVIGIDPRYFRPTEVETLLGDAGKAKQKLGWEPQISFTELVEEMVAEDLELAQRDHVVLKHGYKTFQYHE
jgi:GDPmannose 4,6-dehydratase